jgi:polyisoprenoid-binding protein YceI
MHRAFVPIMFCFGFASTATAETFRLEKSHVDLLFAINHAGFTEKHGSFRVLDATLTYDAEKPDSSSLTVVVKTDSLDTGLEARDKDVKSDKFLDVTKYPEMRFVSTKVTRGAGATLRVDGELTLHGVSKPLTLNATLNKSGPSPFDKKPTLGFSATGSLKRSDFGMSTYLPLIGDEVAIRIDAEFNHPL